MKIKISNLSSMPIYQQIASEIRNKILSNELMSNTQLPSIRALSKELEVGIITIKKAYEVLLQENLIYSKGAVGYFVNQINREEILLIKKEEYLKEENEEADISKICNEEQKDVVVENKEQEKIENFQDNKIKEVLKVIIETQKIGENDLKNYAKGKNMSLNAYIDSINKELYDIVNDQVIILENNTVKIDEFYIDDIKEWLKEND